jgi:hypothetical protein
MKFTLLAYSPLARMLADVQREMYSPQLVVRDGFRLSPFRRSPAFEMMRQMQRQQMLETMDMMRALERSFETAPYERDEFLADTPLGRREKPESAAASQKTCEMKQEATTASTTNAEVEREASATPSPKSEARLEASAAPTAQPETKTEAAPKVRGATAAQEAPGKSEATTVGREAVEPAPIRSSGYSYSSSTTTTIRNGEARTVVRKRFMDADGRDKTYEERRIEPKEGPALLRSVLKDGDTETVNLEGVESDEGFEAKWQTKAALPEKANQDPEEKHEPAAEAAAPAA